MRAISLFGLLLAAFMAAWAGVTEAKPKPFNEKRLEKLNEKVNRHIQANDWPEAAAAQKELVDALRSYLPDTLAARRQADIFQAQRLADAMGSLAIWRLRAGDEAGAETALVEAIYEAHDFPAQYFPTSVAAAAGEMARVYARQGRNAEAGTTIDRVLRWEAAYSATNPTYLPIVGLHSSILAAAELGDGKRFELAADAYLGGCAECGLYAPVEPQHNYVALARTLGLAAAAQRYAEADEIDRRLATEGHWKPIDQIVAIFGPDYYSDWRYQRAMQEFLSAFARTWTGTWRDRAARTAQKEAGEYAARARDLGAPPTEAELAAASASDAGMSRVQAVGADRCHEVLGPVCKSANERMTPWIQQVGNRLANAADAYGAAFGAWCVHTGAATVATLCADELEAAGQTICADLARQQAHQDGDLARTAAYTASAYAAWSDHFLTSPQAACGWP